MRDERRERGVTRNEGERREKRGGERGVKSKWILLILSI